MCVAIFKPAGCPVPSMDILRNCWKANPDGAGVAISFRKCVRINKGFMTMKAFEAFLGSLNPAAMQERAMVLHFRIGTHGHKDAGNTHPFPVSDKPEVLRATEGLHSQAVVHNGIFSNAIDADKKEISDTGQFMVDCVRLNDGDPEIHWGANPKIVGWSKMAILKPNNEYKLLGPWKCDVEDAGGCFYSNLTWQPAKAYVFKGGHTRYDDSGYGDGFGCGGYSGGYVPRGPDFYKTHHWDRKMGCYVENAAPAGDAKGGAPATGGTFPPSDQKGAAGTAAANAAGAAGCVPESGSALDKVAKQEEAAAKAAKVTAANGSKIWVPKIVKDEFGVEHLRYVELTEEEEAKRDAATAGCVACTGSGKSSTGGVCAACNGTGFKAASVAADATPAPEVQILVDGKPVTGFAKADGTTVTTDLALPPGRVLPQYSGKWGVSRGKAVTQRIRL